MGDILKLSHRAQNLILLQWTLWTPVRGVLAQLAFHWPWWSCFHQVRCDGSRRTATRTLRLEPAPRKAQLCRRWQYIVLPLLGPPAFSVTPVVDTHLPVPCPPFQKTPVEILNSTWSFWGTPAGLSTGCPQQYSGHVCKTCWLFSLFCLIFPLPHFLLLPGVRSQINCLYLGPYLRLSSRETI